MKPIDKVKFSKNTLWLKPYIQVASKIVPISKLKTVKGYQLPFNYKSTQHGALHKFEGKKGYHLTIKLYNDIVDYENKHLEMILTTLAHELAHISYWSHPPEHFKLQGKILIAFSKILKDNGIKDYSNIS